MRLPLIAALLVLACSSRAQNDDGAVTGDASLTNDAAPANDARTTNDDGGDSDAGALDCTWLASDANCWRTIATMADSCLPSDSEYGMFNADRSSCTYPSGAVVTFTPPLMLPMPAVQAWSFTVTGGTGQPCVHVEAGTSAPTKVVVAGQTLVEDTSGAIACPDGRRYAIPDGLSLSSCPDGQSRVPGWSVAILGTTVTFGLSGISDAGFTVFSCSGP